MSANVIQVPQLPEIEDSDLLLEVFTHKGIKPYLPGKPCDNERLAELGAQVLSEVVTSHFFKKSPSIRKEEIEIMRDRYTSPSTLDTWLDLYKLKEKLRVPFDQRDVIVNDVQQMATYFHSYIGALFASKGQPPIQAWISELIDPSGNTSSPKQPWEQGRITSRSEPQLPLSIPANTTKVVLLREIAMQRGVRVDYTDSSAGLAHKLEWRVWCYIDDAEKGMGVGKTKKVAMEDAARRALVTMGWP